LRFDYAVTGKPMLFLVPDLVRYQDSRGWLFEFEPTAPGPLLDTTAQVVEAIRDIDAVVDEYAIAYERFRKDFLDLEDGEASARVVDAVFVPNGDADRRDSRR
jgi:CDP-glycerol glycerophosphotransferase